MSETPNSVEAQSTPAEAVAEIRATSDVVEATPERPSDRVKEPLPDQPQSRPRPSEDDLYEAMKDVIDPELYVNVVDLGLVYGMHLDENLHCTVDMTLTSPACPLTDQIEYQVQVALSELVDGVTLNWVWLPPWDMSKITDDGREQLRAVGIRV